MASLNKEKFAYWIAERECIRYIKEAELPKPWSIDPVFQITYFCNVDREDDKVTRAIRAMYNPHVSNPNLTANMIMARMVNNPKSLEAIGFMNIFDKEKFVSVMQKPGSWNGAYIVSTNGRAMPKHEYIAGVLEQAWGHFRGHIGTGPQPTLASAHKAIQALQGMGSFMSAQVVADLKNTPQHPLANASDWWTWASHGPGSMRGLMWFHEYKVLPSNFMEALASARQWCYNNGHKQLIADLCNQNLQNCFCEYDKYMRVSTGTGRSKRKYDGS